MKTKYVKVPVSERLPEKGKDIIILWNDYPEIIAKGTISKFGNLIVHGNVDYEGKPDLYLEEVPDHSEEMLSLLEEVKNKFKPSLSHPLEEGQEEFINQIEQLINKVKDNG
ncbi:hypothetical protein EH151_12675 [Elizabethkingia anophelis]|uniref:hypothetical protein n=1 Tax=Elizabethkingia anophelis TaxID=1117645 RepID=UPI001371AB36|nr:hypothetical protein [Elizabethkingia anophelis]MYZ60741.1 hypothetical protein [Elizabethkingia anophelis]